MFRFLDDDTDMYNTPYTYNAGRTAFPACNEDFSMLAMLGRTLASLFTAVGACFQSTQ